MSRKGEIIASLADGFARINNKLGRLEKKALDFGTGEKFFASELHTIQAIGENQESTVTELCKKSGVTKGAVSQIVAKLERKQCVRKERNRDDGKEVWISLTEKGWSIFRFHRELHGRMDRELFGFLKGVSEDHLTVFADALRHIEKYVDKFLAK